jgi:hypothetical protein
MDLTELYKALLDKISRGAIFTLVNTGSLGVFFITSIFLFKKELLTHNIIYVPFCITFCLASTWYLLTSVLVINYISLRQHKTEGVKAVDIVRPYVFILSILLISIVVVISYFTDQSFVGFLIMAYSLLSVISGISQILLVVATNKYEKKTP